MVTLNFHENHVQYVHSKTDDHTGSHSTQFESFLIVSTKTGEKIFENQCQTSFHVGNMRMSARDVARHFKRHESTICRLLNRFQQTRNVADRPRSGSQRKTMPREDRFLPTSSRRNRFLSSRKLGRLLRNATGTRVCDRTVRNRLNAARLKVCCPYVGIPLT